MSGPTTIVSSSTTSDAVAFAKAVADAGASNKRVVIDSIASGNPDASGNGKAASVTWHTENRGSRLVSWLKDIVTGYSNKVTRATEALIKDGRAESDGSASRKSVFSNVRQITAELKNQRGNVAAAFNQRLGDDLRALPTTEFKTDGDPSEIDIVPKNREKEESANPLANVGLSLVSLVDEHTGTRRAPTSEERTTYLHSKDVETRRFKVDSVADQISAYRNIDDRDTENARFFNSAWSPRDFKLQPKDYQPGYANLSAVLDNSVAHYDAREQEDGYVVGANFTTRPDANVRATEHFIERLAVPANDVELDQEDPFNLVLNDTGLDREDVEQAWFAEPYTRLLESQLALAGPLSRAEALLVAAQVAEQVIRVEASNLNRS